MIMDLHVKPNRKRALFTTIPINTVSIVNQVPKKIIDIDSLNSVEDCVLVANNESFQSGKIQPAIGLHFLIENIPSIDILEYPTWEEYETALNYNYDIVAIGFYTLNFYDAVAMANMARQYGVKEVWAGNYGAMTPGVSEYFDRAFLGHPERDLKIIVDNKPPIFQGPVLR